MVNDTIDKGLLMSVAMMIGNNVFNKRIYRTLAESPKYRARYCIDEKFDNGICRIGMHLKDGIYLPSLAYTTSPNDFLNISTTE